MNALEVLNLLYAKGKTKKEAREKLIKYIIKNKLIKLTPSDMGKYYYASIAMFPKFLEAESRILTLRKRK